MVLSLVLYTYFHPYFSSVPPLRYGYRTIKGKLGVIFGQQFNTIKHNKKSDVYIYLDVLYMR